MNMERFFSRLAEWGISIHLDENGAIRVKGKKEKLTTAVITQLKAHKTQIIQWLQHSQPQQSSIPLPEDRSSLTPTQQQAFEQLTLHGLFEVQALEHSECIAVIMGDYNLSYGQLNLKANRLAHYLRQQGLEPESCIAISVKLGINSLVACLAILKAGGCVLPISSKWSEERLVQILNESEVIRVLIDNHHLTQINGINLPFDNLDDATLQQQLLEYAGVNPPLLETQSAFSLAAILFTAAGQGKGVMLEHGHILCSIKYNQLPAIHDRTCWPLNFDLANRFGLANLFMALCHGGSLIEFQPLVDDYHEQITHLWVDGIQLRLLMQHAQSLVVNVRHLLIVDHHDPQQLTALLDVRRLPTWRLYGALEAGIFTSSIRLESSNIMRIGEGNSGSALYILDEELTPMAVGQAGQVFIAGLGVSRGYTHGWQLTQDYFVPSPFAHEPDQHLFATADHALKNQQQEIIFVARHDKKVLQLSQDDRILPESWLANKTINFQTPTWVFSQPSWISSAVHHQQLSQWSHSNHYLIFMDGFGVAQHTAMALRRHQQQVVEIHLGEQFMMLRSGVYQLNPERYHDYQQLLTCLVQLGIKKWRLVHCWSLYYTSLCGDATPAFQHLDNIRQANLLGLDSILQLLASVEEHHVANLHVECTEINIISHDLFSVTAQEPISLASSALRGLTTIMPTITYHLDVSLTSTVPDQTSIVSMSQFIVHELGLENRPNQVSFRGLYRWLNHNAEIEMVSLTEQQHQRVVIVGDQPTIIRSVIQSLLQAIPDISIQILSDATEIIKIDWPSKVQCDFVLLDDTISLNNHLLRVKEGHQQVTTCLIVTDNDQTYAEKHLKALISIDQILAHSIFDRCVLLTQIYHHDAKSVKNAKDVKLAGLDQHYYQQLFAQTKFHQGQQHYTCIAYTDVEQLKDRRIGLAVIQTNIPYMITINHN